MIINNGTLLQWAPIRGMLTGTEEFEGVTHGLSEIGYDIRVKQDIIFLPGHMSGYSTVHVDGVTQIGNFALASAIEEFNMPLNLMGVVHDKSTWARRGMSVFNTVIKPGWRGFLTLELVFHGRHPVTIPAGCGIAQVVFHETHDPAAYDGKYQGQADEPVGPK